MPGKHVMVAVFLNSFYAFFFFCINNFGLFFTKNTPYNVKTPNTANSLLQHFEVLLGTFPFYSSTASAPGCIGCHFFYCP